jgi:hypothetical protein
VHDDQTSRKFGLHSCIEPATSCAANWRCHLQVLTLGDTASAQILDTAYLDRLEARGAEHDSSMFMRKSDAGGLTLQGCEALLEKLPLLHGLRALHVRGTGCAWQPRSGPLRALGRALAALPGLQVRTQVDVCSSLRRIGLAGSVMLVLDAAMMHVNECPNAAAVARMVGLQRWPWRRD